MADKRLTPPDSEPTDPPLISLSVNEEWWSFLFGALDYLLRPGVWDATGEDLEIVLERVRELMRIGYAVDCDCIKDLMFDPVTGKLTYTDGDGETVTINNAGDAFETKNYYVITPNEPDADDAYCYAAHLLSEKVSDDFQDMLEFIDVLEDFTISPVFETFASMVDLVPFFGDVSEVTIRIIDNISEEIQDWVKENARDVQARSLAAEIFYCGIKIAMEGGGQGSLRAGIITAAGENLIEYALGFVDDKWEIPDLFDVIEDAWNSLDGELLGYAIVAYFLVTDAVLDVLGNDRPIEAILAHATAHAAAHDDRDCAGFNCDVWIAEFDFTIDEQDWFGALGGTRATHSPGNGWEKGSAEEVPLGIFPYCQLDFGSHDTYESVKVEYFLTTPQAEIRFQMNFETGSLNRFLDDTNADYGLVDNENTIPANDVAGFGIDVEGEDFLGYFHKMRVWGTGTIPTQWATYEVSL